MGLPGSIKGMSEDDASLLHRTLIAKGLFTAVLESGTLFEFKTPRSSESLQPWGAFRNWLSLYVPYKHYP